MYTAPADLPSPATVRVTATSAADPTKTATANVTVVSDISIQLTPHVAGVALGALQVFTSVISSAGHPDSTVRWSLSGASAQTVAEAWMLAETSRLHKYCQRPRW
jgi:hypothetical protein